MDSEAETSMSGLHTYIYTETLFFLEFKSS